MRSGSSRYVVMHLMIVAVLVVGIPLPAPGAGTDDAWVAGYASAVLERELQVRAPSLRVREGVISIDSGDVPAGMRSRLLSALKGIRGVQRVDIVERSEQPATATMARTPQGPANDAASAPSTSAAPTRLAPASDPEATVAAAASTLLLDSLPLGFLPGGRLFQPLIADPRWPRLAASYRYTLQGEDGPSVFAASLGETVAFYRGAAGDNGRLGHWEAGLQAGVFSVLDLDSSSLDLINSDFLVAIFGAYRYGGFSLFTRIFHQSSHLGDELLLRETAPRRTNVSFEALDIRLSYDLPLGLRAYGGAGYLFRVDPSDLGRASFQAGAEWRTLEALSVWRARLRPVAGLHLQFREMTDWHTDLSMRAGLQLDSGSVASRNLQLLVEYYNGRSVEGQFFRMPSEYVGLGVHFNF